MNIYFSVDPEVSGGETPENLRRVLQFLLHLGHDVYRAPYALAENPDRYLQKNLGVSPDDFKGQRALHMEWIDKADVLLADVSNKSEGRSMIIQRALDKPLMGLPATPVILIKNRALSRHFGRIIRGLIQTEKVIYFEYDSIEEVENNWNDLVGKASQAQGK